MFRFAPTNLDRNADGPKFPTVIDELRKDDKSRIDFLRACLTKLGLEVNQDTTTVPSLSLLHLSGIGSQGAVGLAASLRDIITVEDEQEYIKDENDVFHLDRPSSMRMGALAESLPETSETKTDQGGTESDRIFDYNSIVKHVAVHGDTPSSKQTPYFNHHAFYSNVREYRSQSKEELKEFGSFLLYGEVVTSTNTLLEK